MSDLTRVDFTAAELRELVDAARTLLREPLGVYPGSEASAVARVTAALKVLRASGAADHRQFVDLPSLAPFAARIIVETMTASPDALRALPARAMKSPAKAHTRVRSSAAPAADHGRGARADARPTADGTIVRDIQERK